MELEKIHKIIDNMKIETNVTIQDLDPDQLKQHNDKKIEKKKQIVSNNEYSEEDQIKSILSKSIVVDTEQGDSLGREFVAMAKEYTKPENRYLFGHTTQMFIFEDSMLEAIATSCVKDPDLKELGEFIQSFRFNYHTGRGAIKGQMRQSFTEFGSSLLAFRGALEWRNAGIRDQNMDPEQRNLWDRLKK